MKLENANKVINTLEAIKNVKEELKNIDYITKTCIRIDEMSENNELFNHPIWDNGKMNIKIDSCDLGAYNVDIIMLFLDVLREDKTKKLKDLEEELKSL